MENITILNNSLKAISNELGLLYHVYKLPRMNNDPKLVNYGIWPSNTMYLFSYLFFVRSAG